MQAYLLNRLAAAVPTIFGITILIFLAMRVLPGDPPKHRSESGYCRAVSFASRISFACCRPFTSSVSAGVPSLLLNLASSRRSTTSATISHYAIQPVVDVYANVQDRDLGGVMQDINVILEKFKKHLPEGTLIPASSDCFGTI